MEEETKEIIKVTNKVFLYMLYGGVLPSFIAYLALNIDHRFALLYFPYLYSVLFIITKWVNSDTSNLLNE